MNTILTDDERSKLPVSQYSLCFHDEGGAQSLDTEAYTEQDMEAYAATPEAPAQVEQCWCQTCRPITLADMRMVVCPDCGFKRCPKANDHRNACTGSNEPGQPGSAYPAQKGHE